MSIFLSKPVLSTVAVIGGCGCIGVPVALKFSGVIGQETLVAEAQVSSGGGTLAKELILEKCRELGNRVNSTINYGDRVTRNVCGYLNIVDNTGFQLGNEERYTNLFKEMGDNKVGNGNQGSIDGKSVCMLENNQGVFTQLGEGKEYLGLCDGIIDEEKSEGMTIENKEGSDLTIKVCQGECFNSSGKTSPRQLSDQKGKGVEIKFQRKEDSIGKLDK